MSRGRGTHAALGATSALAAGALLAVALPSGSGASPAATTTAPSTRITRPCREYGLGPSRLVIGVPPAAIMRSFAILRRRPTLADRPGGEVARLGSVLLATIYTRYVRRLGPGPGGRADFLMVGRSRLPLGPACTARERRLNALARRRFRSQLLVCLNLSCHSLRSIRHGGAFSSSDSGRGPAMMEGLVPDQVARVIAVYPDRPACTVPVRHNVARYLVAHSAPNAFPSRVLFLNGRGKVVGDFPQPASGRSDRYRATACTTG